jgi:hypothetical protein
VDSDDVVGQLNKGFDALLEEERLVFVGIPVTDNLGVLAAG